MTGFQNKDIMARVTVYCQNGNFKVILKSKGEVAKMMDFFDVL